MKIYLNLEQAWTNYNLGTIHDPLSFISGSLTLKGKGISSFFQCIKTHFSEELGTTGPQRNMFCCHKSKRLPTSLRMLWHSGQHWIYERIFRP